MPGLTLTHGQALRELRDYFREMSLKKKREAEATVNADHAWLLACEADAYEHAMDMTVAYLGKE